MQTETAFMLYWRAINQVLERHRLPTLKFGDARALWADAVFEACGVAQRNAMLHPVEAIEEIRLTVREASSPSV